MERKKEKELTEGLQLLIKAPSKKLVDELFIASFKNRNGDINEMAGETASALSISTEESVQLLSSLRYVVKSTLYEYGASSKPSSNLPSSLRPELKELIEKILTHHLPEWKEAAIGTQCALPRVVSMDWRIDIKSASEAMSRMSVPTVLVDLKVAKPESKETQQPQSVIFELNKETITTMIESLKFVQAQLNSVK